MFWHFVYNVIILLFLNPIIKTLMSNCQNENLFYFDNSPLVFFFFLVLEWIKINNHTSIVDIVLQFFNYLLN